MASQVRMDLKGAGQPVTCLGQNFANDDERREHFRRLLRERLADTAFRATPGFPNGNDDDIVNMSDPPYYTACPNPFLAEFTNFYGTGPAPYHRLPYASDVTEGKSDSVYVAHSYHTKVPHKAIMRYILHYTSPGDIVLDMFCGTGMTGVAAALCGSRDEVSSLGYLVRASGQVGDKEGSDAVGQLGGRHAILVDLSPAATFIAHNQNLPTPSSTRVDAANELSLLESKHGWMYRTLHGSSAEEANSQKDLLTLNGEGYTPDSSGEINYAVWSQVFSCPDCAFEFPFWNVAVDESKGLVRERFPCPSCASILTKRNLQKVHESSYDPSLKTTIRSIKTVLVRINYTFDRKRHDKKPDVYDIALAELTERLDCNYKHPTNRLIAGVETRRNDAIGVTHTHHFYTRRNLTAFAAAFASLPKSARWAVTGSLQRGSKQHQIAITRIGGEKAGVGGATAGHRRGTLYIPSNQVEVNPYSLMRDRLRAVTNGTLPQRAGSCLTSTQSATSLGIPAESVDYIFIDPPFGANIAYSELNSVMEAWIGASTSQALEAIEDRFQKKTTDDYRRLMESCFSEAYRVLKPGRWMTVEFSNTQANIWNAIQTALQVAGFVVANVAVLDKKRGGLNAIVGVTAVRQDLIISAYKPNGGLEDRFQKQGLTTDTPWDFVRTHLKNLPATRLKEGQLDAVPERDARRIYDRLVSWFVKHNCPVPISSTEFQSGLAERFPERDGMFFLPNQIDEYDRARMQAGDPPQRDLFVDDERTAIDWLTDFLKAKPSTYQEVHPDFTQKTGAGWRKHETKPELLRLLDENFLKFDGNGPVPSQIHAYLSSNWKELRNLDKDDPRLVEKARNRWFVPDPNKQQDVEARREKALLREFDIYKAHKGKKMKEIRLEVMRVGFKAAWAAKDYRTIIDVSAKVPDEVWQEDERLMMLHSMAETRLEVEG